MVWFLGGLLNCNKISQGQPCVCQDDPWKRQCLKRDLTYKPSCYFKELVFSMSRGWYVCIGLELNMTSVGPMALNTLGCLNTRLWLCIDPILAWQNKLTVPYPSTQPRGQWKAMAIFRYQTLIFLSQSLCLFSPTQWFIESIELLT